MKRFVHLPKLTMIQALLAFVVGCTSIGPAPSPTIGVPTQVVLAPSSSPDTETPSVTTPTQALTATPGINGTSDPTFTLSPTATVCATPSNGITYTIQPGDNLNQIALRYNMSAEELQRANCLPSADTILAGQIIYVPFYLPPVLFPATSVPPGSAQTVIPPDIKGEISLDTGGEPGSPSCPPAPTTVTPQILTSTERVNSMYALCIYDFPRTEELKVDLYAPDMHLVASETYPQPGVLGERTLLKIKLWMPVGAPTGTWSATVASNSITLEKKPVTINSISEPAMDTMPTGEINPFDAEKKCGFYARGEDVVIRGVNFGSNRTLPIGIYLYTPDVLVTPDVPTPTDDGKYHLPLFSPQSAQVNQGNFSISIRIQQSDPPGTYYVLPILDLNEEDYKSFDIKNDCYKVQ